MLLLEILVILVIAGFVANGFKAGIIETLGRLIGAILGYLAAKAFAHVGVTILALFMPLMWAWLVSFMAIFGAVGSLVGFFFKIADQLFKILTRLPILKQINEIAGAILGLLEAIVVIGGIAYLLRQAAVVSSVLTSVINLKTITWIEKIFSTLLAFLL
jgi:hypothetical protein